MCYILIPLCFWRLDPLPASSSLTYLGLFLLFCELQVSRSHLSLRSCVCYVVIPPGFWLVLHSQRRISWLFLCFFAIAPVNRSSPELWPSRSVPSWLLMPGSSCWLHPYRRTSGLFRAKGVVWSRGLRLCSKTSEETQNPFSSFCVIWGFLQRPIRCSSKHKDGAFVTIVRDPLMVCSSG